MVLGKIRNYFIEAFVIFLGVMMAFIAENWRESLQDKEDFRDIMREIEKDIRLDLIEMQSDKARILEQVNCIDQLLSKDLLERPGSRWRTCFDLVMFFDWPDYVLTGFNQLENSKVVSDEYDDELMNHIYEYYQWVDYHYLLTGPAIRDSRDLQSYLITKGFAPINKEAITEGIVEEFEEIRTDPEFVTRLKYLQYNRREELRVYEGMEAKSKSILEMFDQMSAEKR